MTKPSSLGRVAAAGIGIAAVALSIGLVAQGVPQRVLGSLPGQPSTLQPSLVSAEAPNRQVVCSGPFLGFVQQETTPRGFGEVEREILGADYELTEFSSEDLLDVFAGTEGKLASIPVFAEQQASAGFLAGSTSGEVNTPFARGYYASICDSPASESWLVAGSTTTGRNAVLSLANPGSVQAIVDLELFGQSGRISAPAARGILLQPGERRVFSLSGLAPAESSPVIRVISSGTPVTAHLHVSLTRGLEPDGLDVATSQPAPSTTRIIPGLWMDSEERVALVSGREGYSDIGPVLRLLSPESNASVTVDVVRPVSGDVSTSLTLQAGKVFDVALDEFGQGWASIQINSDQPVVAGIRHSSVGDNSTDLAWLPSAAVLSELGSVVVPGGMDAVLHMTNASDEPVTLSFVRVSDDGSEVLAQGSEELAAGEFGTRGVGSQGGNYLFNTTGPVAVSVGLVESGSIATLPVEPPPAELPAVSVLAR